ncbi:MerR family transcriptional regulator [Enterococcus sp. BWM-S5]|uniref:MerR family transcriptional regulator n=1 Tax=Enterococcus larvae TaxID=2794352 RepID=A0ABS4CMC1_9ENTE|nr:MerR family transcriptional regulator [Enterococcus larvae]MBP1047659.1 MerR family transcriptional regulator [Enterococcus larvae]
MVYTIGNFSKKVGLSIDTLRYYEKEKLIIPKRNEINRRVYDEDDAAWIAFIKRLKEIGMPIKKIKEYAVLRYQGEETIELRLELLDNQHALLTKRREEIDQSLVFLMDKMMIYKSLLEAKHDQGV